MDAESQIDTDGGSVVQGDVIVRNGDFVGRDKVTNVLGLTWQQTVLLVVILAGVIVTIWLMIRPPPTPTPLAGDFTIGVAAIGEGDNGEGMVESPTSRALGDEIYRQFDSAFQNIRLDFTIGLGGPQQIGMISGAGVARIEQARARAAALNVNILVYGVLTPGDESSSFVPEFYIDPDAFPRAEEAADHLTFEPILITGNVLNNPVSKNELTRQLVSRAEEYLYFSIGLGHLARNNVTLAADYFGRAYEIAYKLQTTGDRTALLLMLGIVANREGDPQAAYAYYSQAMAIDPGYARAVLGKGQALFLMANQHCTDQNFDRQLIDAALALYTEAETLTPLPSAEIPSKVALFRAQAHTCLAEAGGKTEDWQEAQANYLRVQRNYEANPSPLLRNLAAEASAGLALVILRQDVWNLTDAPPATLADALAAFEQAANLSHQPERRAHFLLWQVQLHMAGGDCKHAQASFDQAATARQSYRQMNAVQPDSKLEEFFARVQAELDACRERRSS